MVEALPERARKNASGAPSGRRGRRPAAAASARAKAAMASERLPFHGAAAPAAQIHVKPS